MKASSIPHRIEPLEHRIAPATIYIGQPDGADLIDTEYREGGTAANPNPLPAPPDQTKFFVDPSKSSDLISQALGVPAYTNDDANNVFFIRLAAGDDLQGYTEAQSYGSLVKVEKGNAVAFFVDYNKNNNYDPGEFTGLALGRDASVTLSSGLGINGDIVTNLDERGTAALDDDTLDMSGLVSARQGITKLVVSGGAVAGSILSGGDIKSLFAATNVQKVLAGTAANGATFDFFGPQNRPANYIPQAALPGGVVDPTGGAGTLTVVAAPGQVGASISNAKIGSLGLVPTLNLDPNGDPAFPYPSKTGVLEAGAGGFGAKGGSLLNIEITKDTNGFQLLAGAGGAGDAGARKANGGAGGEIRNVYVSGLLDGSLNSSQPVTPLQPNIDQRPGIIIAAGDGGDGLSTGNGGAGGNATGIYAGFELNAGRRVASDNLLADNLLVRAGDGGSGRAGGLGGSISGSEIRMQTPEVNGDEIALAAGAGGNSTNAKGRAGAGGSISNVDVRNQTAALNSDVLLQAGNAGTTIGEGVGAIGGSVSRASVLSFDFQAIAGNGSDGKTGGNGGSISTLTMLNSVSGLNEILSKNILLNAGKGGNGSTGNAGNGGSISGVTAARTDIQAFIVNSGVQGNGGASQGGRGGIGGSVTGLNITDIDLAIANAVTTGSFNVRAGNGGDGAKGGGAAGNIIRTFVSAQDTNISVFAGDGGDATIGGNGGLGGSISASQFGGIGSIGALPVAGLLQAGDGGNGRNRSGAGGAGGAITNSNINMEGNVSLIAGDGGSGEDALGGGAAGRGGGIVLSGGFARVGSGLLRAGDAGVAGARPGDGGSIIGNGQASVSGILAGVEISVAAGSGSNGGNGGDVRGLGYGSTSNTLTPTPVGNISIAAGNGSAEGKVAGRGGSLVGLSGSVSSGLNTATSFVAGSGGSADFLLVQTTTTDGTALVNEVQTIDLSPLGTSPVATFALTFTSGAVSSTTANLTPASSAADIKAALEALPSIQALAGAANDKVAVTKVGQIVTVTFNAPANVSSLVASARVGERGGDGGSVSGLSLNLGGGAGVVLTMQAGDGGDAALGRTGSRGGSVIGVEIGTIADATIFRSVAAGDGGDAQSGGLGGSIDEIYVLDHDIGVKSGEAFGFTKMGGLFAGAAGKTLAANGKTSLPGSVTDVSANSIAAIVAGRASVPEFANVVENIYLNGQKQLLLRDGGFGANGPFRLTFDGDTTTLLPRNATPAAVQAALNALPSVTNSGFVDVTPGAVVNGQPTYRIAWRVAANQNEIVALEEQGAGTIVPTPFERSVFNSSEAVAGSRTFAVTETFSGERTLAVDEIIRGVTPVVATQLPPQQNDPDEFQQLDLSQISAYSNGLIRVGYGGELSDITIQQSLPQATIAQLIDTELENLVAVQALGGTAGNAVNVRSLGGFRFEIEFDGVADVPDLASAELIIPETQRLNLGSLAGFTGSTFTLSFKNNGATETTAPLIAAGVTAADIDQALEALTGIQNLNGPVGDKVTVTVGTGGAFNIQFAAIGEQRSITARGFLPETQTVQLDTLPANALVEFRYGTERVTVPAGSDATAIANAINAANGLPSTGGVSVTPVGGNAFAITFNTTGNKLPLAVQALLQEQQTVNLGRVATEPTGEFFLDVTQNVPVTEALKGSLITPTVINLIEGRVGTIEVTTQTEGGNGAAEVQRIDLTGIAGIIGGEFRLSFQGSLTPYLPKNATAAQIDAALEALPSIQALGGVIAPNTPGTLQVNVTQDPANPLLFNIAFRRQGDQQQILAIGGARERQNIDLDLLANDPSGEFIIRANGQSTIVLPASASAANVDAALEQIFGLGSLTVTAPGASPNGGNSFDVRFETFGDRPRLIVEGGGDTSHEIQQLDVSKFVAAGANGTYRLTFGASVSTVELNGTSTAADIDNALEALGPVAALRGPIGNKLEVVETAVGSGVFNVTFSTFGDQLSFAGAGIKTTARLPFNADAAAVEAAIDAVALTGVTVTPGGTNGTFNVVFDDPANQPNLQITSIIHEVQVVDLFDTGTFALRYGADSFVVNVPPNSSAADIELQLQQLPGIQALTPGPNDVDVELLPDSSYRVVLYGDAKPLTIGGTQLVPMVTTTLVNGNLNAPEIQQIRYASRGNFDTVTYQQANIVGAVADFNELGANFFRFIRGGIPTSSAVDVFQEGDTPIDGLVMARVFNQDKVNFTPEAKLTLNGFFDNDNLI